MILKISEKIVSALHWYKISTISPVVDGISFPSLTELGNLEATPVFL